MDPAKNFPVVLVVDDESSVLESFETILEGQFNVVTAGSGKEALEKLARQAVNVVFLDIKMPDMDGMQVLRRIREHDEKLPVIMATADDSARKAVEALQLGAFNYITKPFNVEEVMALAQKAMAQERLLREVVYLRSQIEVVKFENIVGKSRKIKEIYAIIEKVLNNNATILICGESGTGKELIARAIHFNSTRKHKPFIPINCASIPENLLESELFGYEKGAFTGAVSQKLGMFELAHEGTLFLDEISGLKAGVQGNLLRALEEREIRRLGGVKTIKIDVRIISATNVDLKRSALEGKFREDLYYRLNVIPIYLPPLRQRKDDIPLLVEYYLDKYNLVFRKKIEGVSKQALEQLLQYDWPGNIRELKNVIERLVALKDDGIIASKDLPFDIFIKGTMRESFFNEEGLREASNDFQRHYIEAALERSGGNQVKAAKILGIHRNALFSKMKSLGLKKKAKENNPVAIRE